jgi:hypothetical protein
MKRRFINPFKVKGDWFKGNVHTHSVNSDGTKTPEELIGIYRGAGYDFLSITDHSIVLDITGLDGKGLLLVPGGEMCIGRSEAGQFYHLVALGVEDLPFKDFDYSLDPQEVIDHTNAVGGIPIIAHPYWSGLNHGDLMKLKDYHGVEIYNTSCDYERNTGLSASHIDGMIAAGLEPYIYAVDDHHGAGRPQVPIDSCGAWISIKAESLTVKSILDAIKKGHFYSSTGPEIKDITIDENGVISVECSPVKYISFVSTPSLGMKFHAEDESLTKAVYRGRPGETYVRVEVTDYEGRTAWSNPIYNS